MKKLLLIIASKNNTSSDVSYLLTMGAISSELGINLFNIGLLLQEALNRKYIKIKIDTFLVPIDEFTYSIMHVHDVYEITELGLEQLYTLKNN